MKTIRLGGVLVLAGMVAAGGGLWAQTTPQNTPPVSPYRSQARKTPGRQAAVKVIPLETAPPSAPTSPAVQAQQKAQDARLLEQQKQQSVQAAQITNQQVQQAQKQQESVQKEVRIQDAPGPAQTGVVPAAGPPVAPANAGQRIQDAPGPAQTLPPLAPATPTTPPPL